VLSVYLSFSRTKFSSILTSDRTKIQFTTSDRHYELNSVQAAIAFISWFIDVEFCIALPNLQISDRTYALGVTISINNDIFRSVIFHQND
jgi:hypothetical protein